MKNHVSFCIAGWYLSALDSVFLAIYFVEIVLKLYALRSFFFKTGWNIMGEEVVLLNYSGYWRSCHSLLFKKKHFVCLCVQRKEVRCLTTSNSGLKDWVSEYWPRVLCCTAEHGPMNLPMPMPSSLRGPLPSPFRGPMPSSYTCRYVQIVFYHQKKAFDILYTKMFRYVIHKTFMKLICFFIF